MIAQYQALVHQQIPIADYMNWKILRLSNQSISTMTQLQPNINIHGTAFAGSIYAAAMATGWTLLKFWGDQTGCDAQLVAAEATIKYIQPVTDDFECQSELEIESASYQKLLARISQRRSASFPVEVKVICKSTICAILSIQFVFKY